MGDSESVLGLTLAELAFFLVFVMLLLTVVAGYQGPDADDIKKQLDEARRQLDLEKADLVTAQEENERLRKELEDKRSSWLPSCQLGSSNRFLFTVVIRGSDSFQVLPMSGPLDIEGLRTTFSNELTRAASEECVHAVAYYFDPNLSGVELNRGEGRLREDFYLQPLGAYPGL